MIFLESAGFIGCFETQKAANSVSFDIGEGLEH
jgi:hypothetical protein